MATATLSRTTHRADATTPTEPPTRSDRDQAGRRLRDLHAHAGQLVAVADWTPVVEGAVYDLSVELRRTIDEISGNTTSVVSNAGVSNVGASNAGASTLVPSAPGSGTPRVVRFRELGVLHRRLAEALRGTVAPGPVHRATVRTTALVRVLAGTLA